MIVKGYKVFNPDWTCSNSFQYKVGETFTYDEEIKIHKSGFHFCKKLITCFDFYDFDNKNKIAEVEALGEIISDEYGRVVTNKIKIVREISFDEALELVNFGENNFGEGNVGDLNHGRYNIGYHNFGWRNIGSCNFGNNNSGYYNFGTDNSGNFNLTSFSNGYFNTEEQSFKVFDKPINMDRLDFLDQIGVRYLIRLCRKVYSEIFTKDKIKNFISPDDFKTEFKKQWDNIKNESFKKAIYEIPNFDPVIFHDLTGVEFTQEETSKFDEKRKEDYKFYYDFVKDSGAIEIYYRHYKVKNLEELRNLCHILNEILENFNCEFLIAGNFILKGYRRGTPISLVVIVNEETLS